MPYTHANGINLYYEVKGGGEPLVLIPPLGGDTTAYGFQLDDFASHFTCISVDLRGAGKSDKPSGVYTTELFADDVASLLESLGISRAHIFGMSLGGATAMWLASMYPECVRSLSLHSTWAKTDLYMATVLKSWQALARQLGSIPELTITGIFPWSFTPSLYVERPDYIADLSALVRAGAQQPVAAFIQQADACLEHDVSEQLAKIRAPTQFTFGAEDRLTSTRFAPALQHGIPHAEITTLAGCAHAAISQNPILFNRTALDFLLRQQ